MNDWRHTGALRGSVQALHGPLGFRSQAATVALGDGRVLIWGGRGLSADSGSIYDPRSGAWQDIAPAPGKARFDAAAVWTGEEAIIWGGSTNSRAFDFDPGGVAFDPASGTWRELPPAPVGLMAPRAVVYEGGVLIAGGRSQMLPADPVSLWLDLERNSWTVVPAPVTVLGTVWDGKRLLATGPRALTAGHQEKTSWPVVAFDRGRLAWDEIARPIDTEWMALAVARNGTLSAVTLEGLNEPLRAYLWTGVEWNQVAETARGATGVVTIEIRSYPPVALWTGEQLLIGGNGGLTAWYPSSRRFATRSDARFRTFGGAAVWTGSAAVALSSQSSDGWIWRPA